MSVKFIRTCNRCGNVIEEINDTTNVSQFPSTKTHILDFHIAKADGSYDLCDECWEDFVRFMEGKTVLDISLRGKYADTDNAKKAMNEKFGAPKDAWSPEVLELARKHNENVLGKVTEVVKHDGGVDIKATLKDKSAIQLKPGTHTYHRWTKEEDQFIAFHSAGMTMNELANKFGVTLKAVQLRKSMILNGKVHVEKEDLK